LFVFFSCVPYVPEPENTNLLKTAMGIYRKFNQYPDALACAISVNDMELVKEVFMSCKDL
jgi:26S proteasome regulatory subunit N1